MESWGLVFGKMARGIYKNKNGWIRVVEAVVAALLITGAVLVVIDEGYIKKSNPSKEIYEAEDYILSLIQNNNTLREEVLGASLPVNSTDPAFPPKINNTINKNVPAYLICSGKICMINDDCLFLENSEEDIYSRSSIVTANLTNYSPRQVKLFCYRK